MSYLWEPLENVYHYGFNDDFSPPLQPSPLYSTEDGSPLNYEIVDLYGGGTFTVGGAIALADENTAAALIAPWPLDDVEVSTHFYDDASNGHGPELYLRWIDQDNYLVAQFVKPSGQPWHITLSAVVDGALNAPFCEWATTATDLTGLVVRIGLIGNRVTVAADDTGIGVVFLTPTSGSPFTQLHHGATKAGVGARLWDGRLNFLFMRVRGLRAYPYYIPIPVLYLQTHAPMAEPPTLTGGGDVIPARSGKGLAQLLATTDHLRLRQRPGSVGGNPTTAPLIGVLQPIAGSLTGAYGHVEGEGDEARFNYPISIRVYDGTLYVADYGNKAIRAVTLNGPLPGTVQTVVSTEDMNVYAALRTGPDDTCTDQPIHISIDPVSDKMLIVGDDSIADVLHLSSSTEEPFVEVVRRGETHKYGSANLSSGGMSAKVKYPLGDFTNGWWDLTLVQIAPESPRGTLREPGPPVPEYFCDDAQTVSPAVFYWRDGAYAGDGGVIEVPAGYNNATAYVYSHNYVYPSNWGIGLNGRKRPFSTCTPTPLPPNWPPAAGQLYVSGDAATGLPARELNLGPFDPERDHHATVIGAVTKSDRGIIEKYTIDPMQDGSQFVLDFTYEHSRGITYLPTPSAAYDFRTGIYYLAIGENPDSNAEILGWAPNRIVALDLYAPDHVTGTLELPDVTAFIERAPDPVEGTFTPGDTEADSVAGTIDEGTIGHIPIGIRSITGGLVGLIDENGDFIVDEYGNIISF